MSRELTMIISCSLVTKFMISYHGLCGADIRRRPLVGLDVTLGDKMRGISMT